MEKNITVFDCDMNVIGQTYPKRANGLIKKGRAVPADDGKSIIMLAAAPPQNILQEDAMNNFNFDKENIEEMLKNASENIASVLESAALEIDTLITLFKDEYTRADGDADEAGVDADKNEQCDENDGDSVNEDTEIAEDELNSMTEDELRERIRREIEREKKRRERKKVIVVRSADLCRKVSDGTKSVYSEVSEKTTDIMKNVSETINQAVKSLKDKSSDTATDATGDYEGKEIVRQFGMVIDSFESVSDFIKKNGEISYSFIDQREMSYMTSLSGCADVCVEKGLSLAATTKCLIELFGKFESFDDNLKAFSEISDIEGFLNFVNQRGRTQRHALGACASAAGRLEADIAESSKCIMMLLGSFDSSSSMCEALSATITDADALKECINEVLEEREAANNRAVDLLRQLMLSSESASAEEKAPEKESEPDKALIVAELSAQTEKSLSSLESLADTVAKMGSSTAQPEKFTQSFGFVLTRREETYRAAIKSFIHSCEEHKLLTEDYTDAVDELLAKLEPTGEIIEALEKSISDDAVRSGAVCDVIAERELTYTQVHNALSDGKRFPLA
ncbi:MAG: hypothetical protein LUI61_04965 [Firmicutes bacterium]|nr:hypothetical protein [Bacillota bacterium]